MSEDLQAEVDRLRDVLREAHAAIKDMRHLLRQADAARAVIETMVAKQIEEGIKTEVDKGLDEYRDSLNKAIDNATEAVYRRFDTIADMLLGETKAAKRKGEPSLADYAQHLRRDDP